MNTRKLSFDILNRIETEDMYVGEVLDMALRTIQFSDKRDRAFVTRLVEGVTERRISLDFLIDKFSKQKPDNIKTDIRIILRMAIYQIKYMESVPDRAAISEAVNMTKDIGMSGLSGYVNGLLRTIANLNNENKLDSYLVSRMDVRYSTPKWLCDFLVDTYGKDTAKIILEDQYVDHDTVIRINTLKTSKDELKSLLEKSGVTVSYGKLSEISLRISGYDSIRRLPGYRDGLFTVQDETSTYTVQHIGIKPGDKVLDICAAPGGKSMLAYELATDDSKAGVIVSRDISDSKIEKIKENIDRMGMPVSLHDEEDRYLPGINLEVMDATEIDEYTAGLKDEDKFDVVIADVPCSGLGIIGRKNDIKYHMIPEKLKTLAEQGFIILQNAIKYIKNGGRLCFSTCTINPAENGEVVSRFVEDYNKEADNGCVSILEERTFLQGVDGSDGFYYCIMTINK